MGKIAASSKYGLSPTLIRAIPSQYPTPLSFRYKCCAWALACICTSSFYIGPFLLSLPFLLYWFHSKAAGVLLCTNIFLSFHPIAPWIQFRRYFQLLYEMFNLHHNVTTRFIEKSREDNHLSIVAMHPHAIIPVHAFLWGAFCDQLLPHLYGMGCTTDGALRLPLLRHILQWLDVGSAHKNALLNAMQRQDKNIFILPGGVAEIFLSHRRSEISSTKEHIQTIKAKRYGLMKLAIETGAIIYPCFVFGASDLLDQLTPAKKGRVSKHCDDEHPHTVFDYVGDLMEYISRKIQGGVTLYYEGNEFEKNVHGEKRTCKRVENPTPEQVQQMMDKYTTALHNLFEQYKVEAGYPNDKLQII
ncbi:hypothetical protein CTEN210_17698 [Chaetoceros tenuissimus]|uniref:Acyltransferase n=1 Tax=Chaetoceros tenuissimus TaxID=426638 RepID=A0AAD3DC31_9STRA|nr:hypothetical protein CTEN210_17698 [Chaetoceros tenuissimus]